MQSDDIQETINYTTVQQQQDGVESFMFITLYERCNARILAGEAGDACQLRSKFSLRITTIDTFDHVVPAVGSQ
jgi:hypothetical protein